MSCPIGTRYGELACRVRAAEISHARHVPVPIGGATGASAMGISSMFVVSARQAASVIVGPREGLQERSRSNFRGLSDDCVADGVEERWKRDGLAADVSGEEKRLIAAEVRWVMRR